MAIAVYAGTFDPVTAGHLSVIREAARLFSHLVVIVAVNPAKRTLLDLDERLELLRDAVALLPNVTCQQTTGLVVELARAVGASVLIRGVRGATDAQFETGLAQHNRALAPELTTIFLPAAAHLAEVSSSGLKARLEQGEDISAFCTPRVEAALRRSLSRGTLPSSQLEEAKR